MDGVDGLLRRLRVYEAEPNAEALDLVNTPVRVAKMYREELLASYAPGALEGLKRQIKVFPAEGSHEMVVQGPIPFVSLCAHHMMPFPGEAWIGYIPKDKLLGLSKFVRITRFFAAKLQLQERLTTEIADFFVETLDPLAVVVFIEAKHYCMEARGVQVSGVLTRTSALRGIAMTKPEVKSEFLTLIRR